MDVTTRRAERSEEPSFDNPYSVVSSRQCLQLHVPSRAHLHEVPKANWDGR